MGTLGSLLGYSGVIFGVLWSHFDGTLGSIRIYFGTNLGVLWGQFEGTLQDLGGTLGLV